MLVVSRMAQESTRIERARGFDRSLTFPEAVNERRMVPTSDRIGQRRLRFVIDAVCRSQARLGSPDREGGRSRRAEDVVALDVDGPSASRDSVG